MILQQIKIERELFLQQINRTTERLDRITFSRDISFWSITFLPRRVVLYELPSFYPQIHAHIYLFLYTTSETDNNILN